MSADRPAPAPEPAPLAEAGGALRALLFLAAFALYWVTLNPFVTPSVDEITFGVGSSGAFNQLVTLALFGALFVCGLASPMRRAVLQPRALVIALFGWLALTALLADSPFSALRSVVTGFMICVNAAVLLLLPRDSRQFSWLVGAAVLMALALAYYTVLAMPAIGIHQPYEIREPQHAGLWRGHMRHKNGAAMVMVLAVYFGLYVFDAGRRLMGGLIVVLSGIFLFQAEGKTAMAMLPAIIVLAAMLERWPGLRVPAVIGGLIGFQAVTLGAAAIPAVAAAIEALGVDSTFTDRTAVWRLALGAIAERPLTGYGFHGFWQSEDLIHGAGGLETWAVLSPDAHQSYLEIVMIGGLPALALAVGWLVIVPLRDLGRAWATGADPALTRLFARIWLYLVFAACLESTFFSGPNASWFTFLVAVAGLRYQAGSELVPGPAPRAAAPEPARA